MPLLCGELASLISTAAKRSCVACNAVTTSASDHSGTASRIDGSKRSARSVSRRTLSKSSSSTNPLLAVLARPLTVGNLSRFESPRELMGLSGSGTLKKLHRGQGQARRHHQSRQWARAWVEAPWTIGFLRA